MRRLFLGKPVHWLVLLVAIAVPCWFVGNFFQIRGYNPFPGLSSVIVVGVAGTMILTTRWGDRVTGEPFREPSNQ